MAEDRTERRLAAILAADMVGYSKLMAADETGTIERQKAHRSALIDPKIGHHGGRIVKTTGDGILVEFPSVVDAVQCAAEIQRAMPDREAEVPDDQRIRYRVGINLGDIVIDGDDILGDGVNVAARLEALAEPGGICVSQPVHTQIDGKVDLAFEDLGEKKVKNIPRPVQVFKVLLDAPGTEQGAVAVATTMRSRRWPVVVGGLALLIVAAGVALWQRPWEPHEEPASVEAMAFPLPDKPSIAVLPFNNMSDDANQKYFADGMTEDLITDLSKISGLFVIARNSSFSYKGQQVKVRQVAEELGVRYVLEGSVRRAGDEVRINAQLIDATTGGHLWAERYDGTLDDIFDLQDQVTEQIVAALAVSLTGEEEAEQARHDTENAQAHDAFLKGWELYRRGAAEDYAAAVPFLEKAVKLDPDFSRAHAALAAVYWNSFNNRWFNSFGITALEATERSRRDLRKAMKNPTALAHQVASERAAFYSTKADKAISFAEQAIALDANDPAGYLAMANALVRAKRPAEALDFVHQAMRLDPLDPVSYLMLQGRAEFANQDYQAAAATFEKAAERDPNNDWIFVYLGAVYGHLGREQDAEAAVEKANALRAHAGWSALTWDNMKPTGFQGRARELPERELLLEGLEKAGVEPGTQWVELVRTNESNEFEIEGATTIDVDTAKVLHDRGAIFIDVSDTFVIEHIPNAQWLAYYDVFEGPLLGLANKDEEIVIYSLAGEDRTVANTVAKAVSYGFEKVYYFPAGIRGWKRAGHPVE